MIYTNIPYPNQSRARIIIIPFSRTHSAKLCREIRSYLITTTCFTEQSKLQHESQKSELLLNHDFRETSRVRFPDKSHPADVSVYFRKFPPSNLPLKAASKEAKEKINLTKMLQSTHFSWNEKWILKVLQKKFQKKIESWQNDKKNGYRLHYYPQRHLPALIQHSVWKAKLTLYLHI